MGTPSVYSHVTSRSSANLRSSRSVKSLKVPWYRKPLLQDAIFLDVQRAALFTGCFSLNVLENTYLISGFSRFYTAFLLVSSCFCVYFTLIFCLLHPAFSFLSLFTIATAVFDIYCLSMAAPGSTHYGYYILSYEFVYVGNYHVRNSLVMFALFSLIGAMVVLVTSIMLIVALRKEYEKRMIPWLIAFAVFTCFRFITLIFTSIVNDLIFGYNIMMCLLWILFVAGSIYGWLLVYSLYVELSDLTRLEDLAHLRMGTMASLNASTTQSLAGSRPTTPHSTVSTMPVS